MSADSGYVITKDKCLLDICTAGDSFELNEGGFNVSLSLPF